MLNPGPCSLKICFHIVQLGLIPIKDLTLLDRIEGNNYIENKKVHNDYLKLKPFVIKNKFINLH